MYTIRIFVQREIRFSYLDVLKKRKIKHCVDMEADTGCIVEIKVESIPAVFELGTIHGKLLVGEYKKGPGPR